MNRHYEDILTEICWMEKHFFTKIVKKCLHRHSAFLALCLCKKCGRVCESNCSYGGHISPRQLKAAPPLDTFGNSNLRKSNNPKLTEKDTTPFFSQLISIAQAESTTRLSRWSQLLFMSIVSCLWAS